MSLWLLGGHDPTHGAGLYRDLVTARRLAPELPRRFAVTALTEQGRGRPARAWPVPADRLLQRVGDWPAPSAIKVGLLPDPLAPAVAARVARAGAPVVVDPVLRASDGGAMGATAIGLHALLRVATVVTPNRPEALALLGESLVDDRQLAQALAERLWPAAVLLKGGHSSDPTHVCDWLVYDGGLEALRRPRLAGPDPRGTGCALATAVAVGLAQGQSLVAAVRAAVAWLDEHRRDACVGPDGRVHLRD